MPTQKKKKKKIVWMTQTWDLLRLKQGPYSEPGKWSSKYLLIEDVNRAFYAHVKIMVPSVSQSFNNQIGINKSVFFHENCRS